MCGPAINWLHSLLIGPLILASAYFEWKVPLYILGISAILIHGYYMHSGTSTKKIAKDMQKVEVYHATKGKLKPSH